MLTWDRPCCSGDMATNGGRLEGQWARLDVHIVVVVAIAMGATEVGVSNSEGVGIWPPIPWWASPVAVATLFRSSWEAGAFGCQRSTLGVVRVDGRCSGAAGMGIAVSDSEGDTAALTWALVPWGCRRHRSRHPCRPPCRCSCPSAPTRRGCEYLGGGGGGVANGGGGHCGRRCHCRRRHCRRRRWCWGRGCGGRGRRVRCGRKERTGDVARSMRLAGRCRRSRDHVHYLWPNNFLPFKRFRGAVVCCPFLYAIAKSTVQFLLVVIIFI